MALTVIIRSACLSLFLFPGLPVIAQDYSMMPEKEVVLRRGDSRLPTIKPLGKTSNANGERRIEKSKLQHPTNSKASASSLQDIQAVLRQFWDDLGRLDADGLKAIMDWPVTIVEASPTGNKQISLRSPQDFDEEFSHTPELARTRGRSEFYGTTPSGFSIQMQNANLATVSYVCRLPRDIVDMKSSPDPRRFNAFAVLRRDPRPGSKWRIIFITVPK